jgi:probable HAF family extracellular repeat protein
MKPSIVSTLLVVGFFASREEGQAAAYTFTTIGVPGSDYTEAFGINDVGDVVGLFYNHSLLPSELGFQYNSINGLFTTIDAPRNPNPPFPQVFSEASGVNNLNQIVGLSDYRGFLYNDGVFTFINVPASIYTSPNGINNAGQIVGTYYISGIPGPTPITSGFLDSNGVLTPISAPGSAATEVYGINDAGQIIGRFKSIDFRTAQSFIYKDGVFTTINVPGSSVVFVRGINNLGQIVGNFVDASGFSHGFLDTNGIITDIDIPGAVDTQLYGINDEGEIVGSSGSSSFLATPNPLPEPGSLLLVSSAGIIIMIAKRLTTRFQKPTKPLSF